jgi:hypothetical protein
MNTKYYMVNYIILWVMKILIKQTSSKVLCLLNQVSSSDESTKCKSDDEFPMDQSIDSSTKDESDDECKNVNRTYLCNEPSICDCSGDAKFEKIDKSFKLMDLDSDQNIKTCDCLKNRIWKSRNVYNLSNHFEINDSNFELYDKNAGIVL